MTICTGYGCSLKNKCLRYNYKEEGNHHYFLEVPIKKVNGLDVCDEFVKKPELNGKGVEGMNSSE